MNAALLLACRPEFLSSYTACKYHKNVLIMFFVFASEESRCLGTPWSDPQPPQQREQHPCLEEAEDDGDGVVVPDGEGVDKDGDHAVAVGEQDVREDAVAHLVQKERGERCRKAE